MAAADLLSLDGDVTAEAGRGLLAVPARYRLQFLVLAGARLPHASEARVARTAGRLARSLKLPAGLADDALDGWFRDHAAEIAARAGRLTRWYRLRLRIRAALWRR